MFDDYAAAVTWAQDYALVNRRVMMRAVLNVLVSHFRPFTTDDVAINCHHNYVAREHHYGENVS